MLQQIGIAIGIGIEKIESNSLMRGKIFLKILELASAGVNGVQLESLPPRRSDPTIMPLQLNKDATIYEQ
jgi:hypothetical protein